MEESMVETIKLLRELRVIPEPTFYPTYFDKHDIAYISEVADLELEAKRVANLKTGTLEILNNLSNPKAKHISEEQVYSSDPHNIINGNRAPGAATFQKVTPL
jgi:hypothetical protein